MASLLVWLALGLSALPSSLDLTALARSEGAIKRGRRISDGETLLRLARASRLGAPSSVLVVGF